MCSLNSKNTSRKIGSARNTKERLVLIQEKLSVSTWQNLLVAVQTTGDDGVGSC